MNTKGKSHEEWIETRNNAPINSEEYTRAKDNIEDIMGNVNNIQIGNLTDFIKAYKVETDKNIRSNRNLSIAAILVAIIMPLIPMVVDLISKYCIK